MIDLTSEACDSEQLQKAIAESLKDTPAILGGQLTREEQEISRYAAPASPHSCNAFESSIMDRLYLFVIVAFLA